MHLEAEDEIQALVACADPAGECARERAGVYLCHMTERQDVAYPMSDCPVISLVAQGRKVMRFGDIELEFAPDRFLVINGEGMVGGEVLEASRDAPYLSASIELPREVIAKTLLALADAAPMPAPAAAFVGDVDPGLADTMRRYLRAFADPLEQRVVAPLVLEELVFRLLRTEAAAVLRGALGREPDAGAIQRAMQFMRERTTHALSVEDVARHVGMSPSHFAHRFRAIAHTSPMRYLKQLRLGDARTLMLRADLRVAEVAARVGYESASHFTRDFKAYYGAAPAEYIRQLRAAGSGDSTAVPDIAEAAPAN